LGMDPACVAAGAELYFRVLLQVVARNALRRTAGLLWAWFELFLRGVCPCLRAVQPWLQLR
jgi:hypothetical protein